jgi:signal transduction histidine kinase/CheY-like chemotaxis protein
MAYVVDLAEPIEPAPATMAGAAVYQRFEREPDVLAIAVIDPQGRPIGIIERNSFVLAMAAEYGRALYAQRPISVLMNPQPVVVDAGVSLETFTGEVLAERPSELMHGFIVVKDGVYFGMGSALGLLQAANRANRAHAEEMTSLAKTLQAAQAESKAALRAKSEFLAVMSHEIRTPLNGVLSVAEILARRLRQDELQPYVRTILDSGDALLRLLTDVLDLSRMGSGHFELRPRPVRLDELVDDVARLWSAKAEEKGLAWSATYDGPPGLWVMGDDVRLKQVLNNLVGNAMKFTPRGEVRLHISTERDAGKVRLRGEVRDTGMGVDPDKLHAIFQAFVQTDAGRTVGGAGLGLSICRDLLERMDGLIRAEPNPGGGLAMLFDAVLPEAQMAGAGDGVSLAAASKPAIPRGTLPPLKVLIADDNATNRLVAETLCGLFGCTYESVDDGAKAVTAALSGLFDLVLMDIQMPVMGGVEAVSRIRASNSPAADMPVIALTANTDPGDAAAYLGEGMDAVVSKPIKPDALFSAMLDAVNKRMVGAERAA